ncbi:MAG: acetolactate decarboxylase [Methanomicrobiales archaeon]|nr:acetolactate decarboxylase [Methanomicrobiales archaeon]
MDRSKFILGIGLAFALVFFSASLYAGSLKTATTDDRDTMYQVSTIDALMQGVFDGIQPVGDLKHHGDFGIGTFDALEGEMIVLDGIVYQAKADGNVYRTTDDLTTPLATVTYFDRDLAITTDTSMNFTTFSSTMEGRLPTRNMVYAVRIIGTFPVVKVRAIPAQEKPYSTLTEAAKSQKVYTYTNATGTVVGFYTPHFFTGLNVAGYHLHFLSDDLRTGGHVLDLTVPAHMTVEYDITPEFDMLLPTSGPFTDVDLSQNLSEELAKVEK